MTDPLRIIAARVRDMEVCAKDGRAPADASERCIQYYSRLGYSPESIRDQWQNGTIEEDWENGK